nr:MAG TPA: hypothetical protein [Caudoviricetes sp.]
MIILLKNQGRDNNDNDSQNQYIVCGSEKSRV